jgi:hypothetical protein
MSKKSIRRCKSVLTLFEGSGEVHFIKCTAIHHVKGIRHSAALFGKDGHISFVIEWARKKCTTNTYWL